jgi:putative endonuclease
MNKRKIGTFYEELTAAYLQENGFHVTARNFRCRQGEIDIIGMHFGYLVFVEVKYRKNTTAGYPAESVGRKKQSVICQVASYYRYVNRIASDTPVRYDVVAICGMEISWFQNAFQHIGYF